MYSCLCMRSSTNWKGTKHVSAYFTLISTATRLWDSFPAPPDQMRPPVKPDQSCSDPNRPDQAQTPLSKSHLCEPPPHDHTLQPGIDSSAEGVSPNYQGKIAECHTRPSCDYVWNLFSGRRDQNSHSLLYLALHASRTAFLFSHCTFILATDAPSLHDTRSATLFSPSLSCSANVYSQREHKANQQTSTWVRESNTPRLKKSIQKWNSWCRK